jgi:hypothetical protein
MVSILPTAMVASAAIPAATSLIGGGQQASGAQAGINAQQQIYQQNQQLLNPYVQGGLGAYNTLNGLLGVGGNSASMQSALENLPGYQFTLNQGLKSVQNGMAARGLADSGAALKGAASYATGLANSGWNTYANALQNSAGTGMQAGSAIAGVGQNTGQGIAASNLAYGQAQAAGTLGAGNAVYNAIGAPPLYSYLGGANNSSPLGGLFGLGNGGASTGFDYSNLSMIP